MNRQNLTIALAISTLASAVACSSPVTTLSPQPIVSATAMPSTSAPNMSPLPISTPATVPSPNGSASPTPVPTPVNNPNSTGSATFTSPMGGYDGLVTPIALLDTTEKGGGGNAIFISVPHGQPPNGNGPLNPNRQITLEINDFTPISNSTTYGTIDFSSKKILIYYTEDFGVAYNDPGRFWIGNAGNISFQNVGNGSATYKLTGINMIPDPYRSSNSAVGSFTLDAIGTAKSYTSN